MTLTFIFIYSFAVFKKNIYCYLIILSRIIFHVFLLMVIIVKEKLDLHMERSLSCNECGAKFCFKSRLQQHYKRSLCKPEKQSANPSTTTNPTVSSEFKCDKCEKTFSYKWNLTKHKKFINCTKPGKCTKIVKLYTMKLV